MCLSTVYVEKNGKAEKVMQDVSQMLKKDDGLLLVGMFGDETFIKGHLKSIDFQEGESVVIGQEV